MECKQEVGATLLMNINFLQHSSWPRRSISGAQKSDNMWRFFEINYSHLRVHDLSPSWLSVSPTLVSLKCIKKMHHQHSSRSVKIGRWRRRTETKERDWRVVGNFKIWIILPPFARGFGSFAASFGAGTWWKFALVSLFFLLENDYNHIRWVDFSRTKAPLFCSSRCCCCFFSCVRSRSFIKCRKAAKEALKSSRLFFPSSLKAHNVSSEAAAKNVFASIARPHWN